MDVKEIIEWLKNNPGDLKEVVDALYDELPRIIANRCIPHKTLARIIESAEDTNFGPNREITDYLANRCTKGDVALIIASRCIPDEPDQKSKDRGTVENLIPEKPEILEIYRVIPEDTED